MSKLEQAPATKVDRPNNRDLRRLLAVTSLVHV